MAQNFANKDKNSENTEKFHRTEMQKEYVSRFL